MMVSLWDAKLSAGSIGYILTVVSLSSLVYSLSDLLLVNSSTLDRDWREGESKCNAARCELALQALNRSLLFGTLHVRDPHTSF